MKKITLSAVLVGMLSISASANAAIMTFDDKTAFLAATGATSATGPLPNLGGPIAAMTFGSVTIDMDRYWLDTTWTTRLSGPVFAISYGVNMSNLEDLDAILANPVYSFGFDFVEPENDPNVNWAFVDSTFQVTLKSGLSTVGSFTYNAPNDVAAFVGVWSTAAFDRAEIREIVGLDGNEFYGEFYTGTTPKPITEPGTLAILGLSLVGLGAMRRRRCPASGVGL
jgi:hypothetical protein